MSDTKQVALGFRAHSGWAAVVAIGGSLRAPEVIDRRRIITADPAIPGSKQPYHAAEKLELKAAEKLIARCTESSRLLARQAVREVLDDLRKSGHKPIGCGILLASGRPVGTLEATLASHAMLHTAEGQLFRDVLARASSHWKLPVTGVRERELFDQATAQLRIPAEKLRLRLNEMGKAIGSPWTQDEKLAALVAWLVL